MAGVAPPFAVLALLDGLGQRAAGITEFWQLVEWRERQAAKAAEDVGDDTMRRPESEA